MSRTILDIDFDFFFDSETPLREAPDKRFWCNPATLVFPAHLRPTAVVEHHEIMLYLDAEQVRDATYYHLDAHHDLYLDGAIEDLMPGARAGFLNEANYLAYALRDGLIGRLYSVCPDWQSPDQRKQELLPKLGAYADRVIFIRFAEIRETISRLVFDQVFTALSPSFTPPRLFEAFAEWSGCSPELLERARDGYQCTVVAGYSNPRFNYYYNLPPLLPDNLPCLYHGSKTAGINNLEPGEDGILYLSPSPGFAACFGMRLNNDDGWVHGVDLLTEGQPFVYMVVPESQSDSLDKPIYLYRVDRPDNGAFPVGSVPGFEYGTSAPLPVKACEFFPSAREAFARLGVRVVSSRSPHQIEGQVLRRVQEHRHDVETCFEMPLAVIKRLTHIKPLLHAFLIAVAGIPPDELDPSCNFIWKSLLTRVILPTAFLHSEINHNAYHGMDHCHEVAMAGGYIALARNRNPLPALLAGAVHDICRSDAHEEDHGAEAARKLPQVLKNLGKGFFEKINLEEMATAIREHSWETPPSSDLSASLRDADRLRLSWERGFDPRYFATETGAVAARLGRYYLLSGIENTFAGGISEVKAEVTHRCNLACPFCHQGFGVKKGRDQLAVEEFRQMLMAARAAGVRSIRITGGEPCLHPDFERLLEMVKEFNMDVILNTNGTAQSVVRYLEFAKHIDCFKISLPFAREEDALNMGLSRSLLKVKLELMATLYVYGHTVEALTIMTPQNIERHDDFIELLDPLRGIRWVPLRAEPSETERRPVSRDDIRQAARKILHTRQIGGERWSDLQLHLAVPFCVLEDSSLSPVVFSGRRTCGPIQSLTFTPDNQVISCYSERDALPVEKNLQATAWRSPHRHLDSLPDCCRACIHGYLCMGGCITDHALEDTPYGRLDYLADPASLHPEPRSISA